MKPVQLPPSIVKLGLIASVLPFVGFGAYLVGRTIRTHGADHKFAIPFILFVVLFCAIPVAYVFSRLHKLNNPAARPSEKPFVITALVLLWSATAWILFYTRLPRFIPIAMIAVGVCGVVLLFLRRRGQKPE